ncbi:hypothetical protein TNCV_3812261 [Trichonephila clavipes]|nr:hypothetical protein TNCV_3812261 [Trichonephila clavipes]
MDGQQRWKPLRHLFSEAINHELRYSVPLFQKSSFQFLESLWGWLQLVFLERPKRALLDSCLENTLAIHSIPTIPSSKRKCSTRLA